MYKNKPCTLIDVDEAKKIVRIKNYVDNVQFTAFGSNTEPSIADYEDFLESRCLPRSRDKIKLELKESDIPFYDPYLIVKKRRGEWQKEYNQMTIRRANENDIPRLLELLEQVLQIHADIRPDIFIPGTTKYTNEELTQMIKDDTKPIYVAADENDNCLGYAFCQLREQPFSNNMVPFTSLFIDDLCVDASTRGQHIGEKLFVHVKEEAKRLGCYEVTLNVWAGNTSAEKFYEKMGLKTKERQMEYIL